MVIVTGQPWFDSLAIGASALYHYCLILAFVLVLVPTLAVFLTIPERFHLGVFLCAIPSSGATLWIGHRRHRRRAPMLLAIAGFGILAAGLVAAPSEQAETLLTVVGSCLLAFGHVENWGGLHRYPSPRR